MIKAIIFDWSGVISDDRKPVYEANMLLLEFYGIKRITFEEWLPKTKSGPIEYLASYGIQKNPEVNFEKYKRALNKVKINGIHPQIYKDVFSVLEELFKKGLAMAVLSKHPHEDLLSEAKEYNVSHFFNTLAGSTSDKTIAILDLLKKLKIRNTETCYIGDTIYDVETSKKAKVISVAITTGYHSEERLKETKPTIILNSLSELLKHV